MTGVYFLSFSLEKEKERKYQRKEKKSIIFMRFVLLKRRYLFARAGKYGARETVRCFFRAFWYGDGLRINAALILAELFLFRLIRSD